MKIRPYINFIASVFLLSACVNSVEETAIRANFTVGDEDNEIVLMAGVRDGGTSVTTRAADPGHSNHTPFKSVTKMALRIDGTWLGNDPESIIKSTSATITTNKVKDDKHNEVKFEGTEKCYWDDYGTADPANMSLKNASDEEQHVGNGRDKGLTIYAACVEGESTAPTISSWTSQPWSVGTPTSGVINQTGGWANVDLLTSNNITASADGTYKFDDWMNDLKNSSSTASNLLIFTHAMTKITVELTAGLGFVDSKFVGNPTVKLLGFYYTGNVNVVNKSSSPTSTANIDMHRSDGGAGNTTATYDALVFPGNTFDNGTDILTLTADGNTYFVTAKELNAAIQKAIDETATTGYPTNMDNALLHGWNYKLKITVNQTDIKVEATIVDWKDVEADEEAPKINFSQCYGQDGTNFGKDFTLYRSKNVTGSYINGLTEDNSSTVSYASSKYTMSPQLYWPDHQTHYFFRGVWPVVDSKDTSAEPQQLGPTSSQVKASYVEVANVAYKQGYYPSDLMIGMPRKEDGTLDETCKAGHNKQGICATDAAEDGTHANNKEGLIHLNFEYAMSQVEVELKTVDSPDAAKVNINANTVVELVNVYNSGEVKLSDGSVSVSGDKGSYTLDVVEGSGNELKRHSAIVPQVLTYSTEEAQKANNLRFKITVTNDDAVLYANAAEYNAAKGTSIDDDAFAALTDEQKTKTPATTDVYYADVNPILKSGSTSEKVAPNGQWESGVHYKYILTLSKTAIKVTATLKDWVTVTASDNIWF
ncbi:MAG: fimbrillin family protein [Bacteroidaceae bacterium]|nr:fimbrillin family protein [Bacteroidaceae bacterium]